jgi:hypothetical protein
MQHCLVAMCDRVQGGLALVHVGRMYADITGPSFLASNCWYAWTVRDGDVAIGMWATREA